MLRKQGILSKAQEKTGQHLVLEKGTLKKTSPGQN